MPETRRGLHPVWWAAFTGAAAGCAAFEAIVHHWWGSAWWAALAVAYLILTVRAEKRRNRR